MNKINIGEQTTPRYEFRTFGYDLNSYLKLMQEYTQPVPKDLQIRHFYDVYIISKNTDNVNIKVKKDLLDVKKLIRVDGKLEQWDTIAKHEFPISKELFLDAILSDLKVDIPVLNSFVFNVDELLSIAKHHKDLLAVSVQKKRHAFIINVTICEFAEVLIDEENLFSVAVESTNKNEVQLTLKQLGLDSFNNINYVKAIKQIKGLSDTPFAN